MDYIIYGRKPKSKNQTDLAFVSVGESLRDKIDSLFDDGCIVTGVTAIDEHGNETKFRFDGTTLKHISSRTHEVLAKEFENRFRN